MPGRVGSKRTSRPESVVARMIRRRISSGEPRISRVPAGSLFAILRSGPVSDMIRALGDVARQLDVLLLVIADRYEVGVVEEDVGSHQRLVGEEPGAGALAALLGGLV